ncbi:signal peptidase I [Alkalibacillus filiformis]|uniref:Signal peptidase I n=1 Tax=Alkalibacillus filiformis TaxID=200990 RepID=A0ABU0DXB1_9BACI|nr:signal peptidase I [Alkalibacillus filiformis]MDQ0353000.1 signal peptidase I [Alkalibacillus filiformis]
MRRFYILPLLLLVAVGCSDGDSETSITDPQRNAELETVSQEDMIVIKYESDNMERGDNPYNYLGRDLVIDPDFYIKQEVRRGEIVYYERPEEYYNFLEERQAYFEKQGESFEPQALPESVARVVALPGESIEIQEGQIYIDGRILDTFYGDITLNPMNETDQEFNMEAVTVPDNHVFVLGDRVWRSIDSKQYGPVSQDNFIGKVKGYPR